MLPDNTFNHGKEFGLVKRVFSLIRKFFQNIWYNFVLKFRIHFFSFRMNSFKNVQTSKLQRTQFPKLKTSCQYNSCHSSWKKAIIYLYCWFKNSRLAVIVALDSHPFASPKAFKLWFQTAFIFRLSQIVLTLFCV